MDPITVSVAAKYVAKVGGPKLAAAVAEKVRQRGWARRAAKRAFGGVQQQHPVGATAKWLKAPGTLGRLYDAVLTENGPRWATKIASDRNLQAHRETQAKSDLLLGNDARGNESEVKGRIAQLPKLNREAALTRWRDAKEDTWRVISLVTSVETSPPEVVVQWQAACPDWLTKAEVSARLVAADLAWAYGAPRLAANLYGSAARDGAPLAHRWAGRAAFVLLFDEDPGAARALTLESLRLGDDPMSLAVDLVIDKDWPRLRGLLDNWSPTEPIDRMARFMLVSHEVMFGHEGEVTPAALDGLIATGRKELSAGHTNGVALILARLLTQRVDRFQADHPYADLREAQELATNVRDEQRAVRARSAAAVTVACAAAQRAGDPAAVMTLGSHERGEATEEEAADPEVRQMVALARAMSGEGDPVRAKDELRPFVVAQLRAIRAERAGGVDPVPHWQEALTLAGDDYERATALMGLARAGQTAASELGELGTQYPSRSREIRAVADLAQGRNSQAITDLRTLLDPEHADRARNRFRLVTVDTTLADAPDARSALTRESPGAVLWDEQAQSVRIVETDEDVAATLADASKRLVADIERIHRMPRPIIHDPDFDSPDYSPWYLLIELAATEGFALWVDDAALRTLARSKGVPAFSTLAVLHLMEEDETISGQERREIDGALIRGRVGDLPLIARPELLMELAEEDRWLPGGIAVAMGRPGAWADFTRTMATLQPLVQAIIANQPQSLPAWIYRFTRGVAYRHHDQPEVARQVALASLIATMAYLSRAQGPAMADLVRAVRQALPEVGCGTTDPVVPAAQLMWRAMRRRFPGQAAAQYMLGVAADLDPTDRDAIVLIVLTD
jgi:hypothetical protein